ncbi:MAG: response regulator [Candidatus Eremiobacteraeota bacterium]|nr:response regulator [Candidatus Eremiobacteraeota bacterium]
MSTTDSRVNILVVDDDPNIRKTLCDILRLKGYEAAAASTGAEAIEAAGLQTFNLALIDLILPDILGLEVMARIKAISTLTEAIILTGHASLESAVAAVKDGAFSYLHKPCDMGDLLEKIDQAVELRQAQLEIQRLASFPQLHPSPVIELDAAGTITYANPSAERLFPDLKLSGLAHPCSRKQPQESLDYAATQNYAKPPSKRGSGP